MSHSPQGPDVERYPHFTKAFDEDKSQVLFNWELSTAKDVKPAIKKKIRGYLASRDGFICTNDGIKISNVDSLDIHHLNDDHKDWHRWNLCLMEHPCNSRQNAMKLTLKRRMGLHGLGPAWSHDREREIHVNPSAFGLIQPRPEDAYSNRVKARDERPFRRRVIAAVLATMRQGDYYDVERLVARFSEEIGLGVSTAYKYMQKLTGEAGPLDLQVDKNTGIEYVVLRYNDFKFLTVDELEELYPVSGQRFVDPERAKKLMAEAQARAQAEAPSSYPDSRVC